MPPLLGGCRLPSPLPSLLRAVAAISGCDECVTNPSVAFIASITMEHTPCVTLHACGSRHHHCGNHCERACCRHLHQGGGHAATLAVAGCHRHPRRSERIARHPLFRDVGEASARVPPSSANAAAAAAAASIRREGRTVTQRRCPLSHLSPCCRLPSRHRRCRNGAIMALVAFSSDTVAATVALVALIAPSSATKQQVEVHTIHWDIGTCHMLRI